jgi:pimeloyl-ACP methyl ester carboxylesterase
MTNRMTWACVALLGFAAFAAPSVCRADPPTTAPSIQLKPGPMDLTFTQRSPLSKPKEIARRLSLKPADVADDYDLSQQTFKAYVPKDFDPAVPQGLLVFLGYKDTTETPRAWQPILDTAHVIFIGSVAHHGEEHPPSIPTWQTFGMALDAANNIQQQCKIDPARVYLMGWDYSTEFALAYPDIFTGYILVDPSYFKCLSLPDGRYMAGDEFAPPMTSFYSLAKRRPFFFVARSSDELQILNVKMNIMKRDGFSQVQTLQLSIDGDLHYPNLSTEWFEKQTLPFLDAASAQEAKAEEKRAELKAAQPAVAAPDAAQSPAAPAPTGPSEAAKLLKSAQLYIANNLPDLAKPKLQQILDTYPDDPAAVKAKELLGQINQ